MTYIRPYVTDFSPEWLLGSSLSLVAGALALIYIAGGACTHLEACTSAAVAAVTPAATVNNGVSVDALSITFTAGSS